MAATLLLADDSVTIQRVIELTFAGEDVAVVAVGDGDAAIARLESSPPDIVLADIGMPGRSGYDVAQFVKQSPRLAHIPVVLLTGAFEPIDRGRAAAVGCDGVFAKPFEPQLVVARVKELLDQRRPALLAAAAPGQRRADLDEYFDQLDAAFANLTSSTASRNATPPLADVPDVPLSDSSRDGADSPGVGDSPAAPPPPLGDEAIDRIAIRVAAQLSDRAVREAVNEIVAATAERLVREEIERIKAGIK